MFQILMRKDERLTKLASESATVATALSLSDEQLFKAWRILMGPDYHRLASMEEGAYDMLTILRGGNMPCIPFRRWDECIKYINDPSDV
jgi:hypothetical protein